ncbi:MAG: TldD/PmbA family protein [Metallosphaera sp.]
MEQSRLKPYAIQEISSQTLIIKVVESKIETIQRLHDRSYNVLLRKGNKFIISRVTSLDEVNTFNLIDELPESRIVPTLAERSGDYEFSKVDNGIVKLIEDSSILLPIIHSRYPLYGTVTATLITKTLETTYGFKGKEKRTWFQGYFRAKNGNYSGQWAFASSVYDERKVRQAIERAEDYASITGNAEINDGNYDVVLSPLVMANLMASVAYSASGYSILTGNSFLSSKKVGEDVGSEKFSLIDNPKNDELNSWEFDDEAVPTRRTVIIDKGKYVSPILNIEVGRALNMETTGNAGWVYPRPWTLEVPQGETSESSLLDGNVILFNNNWYTRFQNRAEGQFSTVGRDAVTLIKNGKPVGVVGRVRIADKLGNIISNVQALSKERYSIAWWDAPLPGIYPFALVSNVRVSKA